MSLLKTETDIYPKKKEANTFDGHDVQDESYCVFILTQTNDVFKSTWGAAFFVFLTQTEAINTNTTNICLKCCQIK